MVRSKLIVESQKQRMSHQASVQQDVQRTAHAKRRYHRNKKGKVGHTCQSRRGSTCETEPCRGRKDGNEAAKKAFKGAKHGVLLAAGDRLGKKRQMHRWFFSLETTVLSLKCRSLCTKNTVVLASAPQREQKRTEERHKLWGGEGTKNTEQGERI